MPSLKILSLSPFDSARICTLPVKQKGREGGAPAILTTVGNIAEGKKIFIFNLRVKKTSKERPLRPTEKQTSERIA